MEWMLSLGILQMGMQSLHGRETVLPYVEAAFYFHSQSGGFGVKISLQSISGCAIYLNFGTYCQRSGKASDYVES